MCYFRCLDVREPALHLRRQTAPDPALDAPLRVSRPLSAPSVYGGEAGIVFGIKGGTEVCIGRQDR